MEEDVGLPLYLFHQGTNYRAEELLGVHRGEGEYIFRVWAPHATCVFLVGDFNAWGQTHPMQRISEGGVWECRVRDGSFGEGSLYKFKICHPGGIIFKADPYATGAERAPGTASVYRSIAGYRWQDEGWMRERARKMKKGAYAQPINIYELHVGSWKHRSDGSPLSFGELAAELAPYLKQMGYTHVELLPVMEHPFDGSWGYQVTGYFAPCARYGTPHELMAFVDAMHGAGIGVILDWVPAHFPKDAHGLMEFDGAPLYEYQGADRMEHRTWGTRFFDVGREEVQCFLVSNACYWAREYHVDGLRVDAVASMLYLDYDRLPHEWVANVHGDNRNLEAIAFFKKLNGVMQAQHSDVLMIAEESSAWGNVTGWEGDGLGFSLKWNMGWMNDTLFYASLDPIYRKFHHTCVNFSLTFAFSERYVLPISHDEVVHGKRSLLDRMPGDYEQKFDGVRLFLAYMMAHPGKKLLFMGSEIGQFCEWDHSREVEWFLLGFEKHAALQHYVAALNHFYLQNPPFYELDLGWEGFSWIEPDNAEEGIVAFCRKDLRGEVVLVILNFTPVCRKGTRIGVPFAGEWREVFNSDLAVYGGRGVCNPSAIKSEPIPRQRASDSILLDLPSLGAIFLKGRKRYEKKAKKHQK